MDYKRSLLIVALLGLADILHVSNCEVTAKDVKVTSGCHPPFQTVKGGCYYFSEALMDFESAETYCESLGNGHIYNITLAMLDYSREEDQAILDAVAAAEGQSYWVGGKTEDGVSWKWVDSRDINPKGSFWDRSEPNDDENKCLAAESVTFINDLKRAYLYDHQCSDSLNFICQSARCPINFIEIGNYCYLQSWAIGVPSLPWQDARDYCRSVSVFDGYYGDLAVLSLPDQDDYHIMDVLTESYSDPHIWMGAYLDSECYYQWIDGRELALESIHWGTIYPSCANDHNNVLLYYASPRFTRACLEDYPGINTYPFACQMFKNQ